MKIEEVSHETALENTSEEPIPEGALMATLLQIGDELETILAIIEDADGELPPELDTWFETVQSDLETKADGFAALCREVKLRAAVRREESERLAKLAQAGDNLERRLKDRLKEFMEYHAIPRIDTARFRINVQRNGGVQGVRVDVPAEQLPAAYQRHKVEPDTDAIRKALLAGQDVPGAELMERGTHLRIT